MDKIVNPTEAKLSPQECRFVAAVLEGTPLDHASAEAGLDEGAAKSAADRAVAALRSLANELADRRQATKMARIGDEDDISVVLEAVSRLEPKPLAGIAARFARRLLPNAAYVADGLPNGKTHLQVATAALERAERFALGGLTHSDPRGLIEEFESACNEFRSVIGAGEQGKLGNACLIVIGAALAMSRGAEQQGKSELNLCIKSCSRLALGAYAVAAAAADARWILKSSVDASPGNSLYARPLWPQGEPSQYFGEAERMHKYSEGNLPPAGNAPAEDTGKDAREELAPFRVRISPLSFLRSMATILWSTLRHPGQTTEVDLSTGRVVRHY